MITAVVEKVAIACGDCGKVLKGDISLCDSCAEIRRKLAEKGE